MHSAVWLLHDHDDYLQGYDKVHTLELEPSASPETQNKHLPSTTSYTVCSDTIVSS